MADNALICTSFKTEPSCLKETHTLWNHNRVMSDRSSAHRLFLTFGRVALGREGYIINRNITVECVASLSFNDNLKFKCVLVDFIRCGKFQGIHIQDTTHATYENKI